MRVLQINAVYWQLSTGRSAAELSDACQNSGHDTMAAFSVGKVFDPHREYLIGGPFGQKIHAVLSRLTGLQGYFSRHATKKLLRFMDQYRPDVVVLRNLHANYIHLPMLLNYLAQKDIPTVAVLHDCWFYTGNCCHYTVTGCYRWQESCGNCPAKKDYNASWLFDRSRKMLRDKQEGFGAIPRLGVVAVSDWMLSEAKKAKAFANATCMQRIYNWVDRDKFRITDSVHARKDLGLGDEKIILCVAGAWDEKKGIGTVVRLADMLSEQERVLLVGSVGKGVQLPEKVIHIPKTGSVERLVALYNAADVFLQPSLEETFGKVSSEALACGTPVVCFDSTANPELVGENCGAVVPVGDLEGMLHAVRQIFANGKASYSQSCRAFAAENFDMQKSMNQYMQLFLKLQTQKPNSQKEGRKMRVLWIVNMVLPDAAKALNIKTSFSGSWLVDPLKSLSEDDQIELATMTYGFVEKQEIITVNNVKHYIFPGAGKRLLFTSKETLTDCQAVLDDFKPDLIHIYGTEYSIGYSMTQLNPPVPVLMTIQGILTHIAKSYRAGLSLGRFFTMATVKEACRLKLPVCSQWLFRKNARRERKTLARIRYATGRTEHDRQFINSINPGTRYYRLNYNLREVFYGAQKWELEKTEPYTIFTGAAGYPLKGLHQLLEALAKVKKTYPQVKLYVPGNATCYEKSNGYERYLWRRIKKLGLQENVVFVGRKTAEEMIDHLQKAHIYAFPSAYDTDSLSLCEAQLLGVPVVAAKRGGTEYLVEDQNTGLLYRYEDTDALAENICKLFREPELCRQLSVNEIRTAEERHDRQKNTAAQIQLYWDLLQEK